LELPLNFSAILIFISAFLIGAIPFSVIISKFIFKKDVRKSGSGNPGATNVLRTLGPAAGAFVLVLDMGKGFGAVYLSQFISSQFMDEHLAEVIAGLLAILGHIYSPFLKFKGGKGVATTFGVILALQPIIGLAMAGIFIIIVAISKYVSLGSILSVCAYPILIFLFGFLDINMLAFALVILLLVVYNHRDNIKRLMRGEENRISFGSAKPNNS
jgi:glycerol-3-phosphate acyltransferase PlsY